MDCPVRRNSATRAGSGDRQGDPLAAQKLALSFMPVVGEIQTNPETFLEHMLLTCADPFTHQQLTIACKMRRLLRGEARCTRNSWVREQLGIPSTVSLLLHARLLSFKCAIKDAQFKLEVCSSSPQNGSYSPN
jgi:hypothetical protein